MGLVKMRESSDCDEQFECQLVVNYSTFLLVSHQGFFSAQVRDEDGDEGMVDMQISTIKLLLPHCMCLYMYLSDQTVQCEQRRR